MSLNQQQRKHASDKWIKLCKSVSKISVLEDSYYGFDKWNNTWPADIWKLFEAHTQNRVLEMTASDGEN